MRRSTRVLWLGGLLIGVSIPLLPAGDEGPGPTDLSPGRQHRGAAGTLREVASLVSLIERLDAARKSGEALPVHALDLALRTAVEGELNKGHSDPTRERVRPQVAERVAAGEDAASRDEAYRTPVSSWVEPREAPQPGPRQAATPPTSAVSEADLERRLRAAVHELSQLDGVLDEAGLNARRDLLGQLLQVARDRERSRHTREAAAD